MVKDPYKKIKKIKIKEENCKKVESLEMEVDVKEEDAPKSSQSAAKFDRNLMKKRLMEENDFISDVLDLIYIPKHKRNEDEEEDELSMDEEQEEESSRKMLKSVRATSLGELHQRLEDKMKELRGGKEGKEKKKKKKLSKVEKKIKMREEKKLKAKMNKMKSENKSPSSEAAQKKVRPAKPVYNKDGKMVFSKFDFTEENNSSSLSKKVSLDPKAALKKLQVQKEKIASLKEIGKTDRVKNLVEKTTWQNVLDKSQGLKVKDDETLLKKSIKKMEQKKKSSKKKWVTRKETVSHRKDSKQKKRDENIAKRKKDVKQSKLKKAAKKGRIIPGFA